MTDDVARELINKQGALESGRANWEHHWREIAERMLPGWDDFRTQRSPGEKRTQFIIDGTSQKALQRHAGIMNELLTPSGQEWHGLEASIAELNEIQEVKVWFDAATTALFKVRNSAAANFPAQNNERWLEASAFGTGALYVDDVVGQGTHYKSCFLGEIFIQENARGLIDLVYRKFKLTAKQAVERFRNMPQEIIDAAGKDPSRKFEFLHCMQPNPDFRPDLLAPRFMKFQSWYVSIVGERLLTLATREDSDPQGGFRTNPYSIARYLTTPTEVYGRSPAMMALPEQRMLNEIRKTDLRARHRTAEPPILLPSNRDARRFRVTPNALNFGAVDAQGRQLAHALNTGSRPDISADTLAQSREQIADIFDLTLFQILIESPQITATEALLRAQEKGVFLSPTIGRQQSEALGPMIERELDLATAQNLLPPMPGALIEAEGEFEIVYKNEMTRTQRASDALGTERTVQSIIDRSAVQPDLLDKVNWDEYADIISEANGSPARLMNGPDVVQSLREGRQQQAEATQLAEAAPGVAGALKSVAEAGAISGAV